MMDIIDLMKNVRFISKQVTAGTYYFLNLRPAPTLPAAVVCGGLEHCAPDYHVSRRRFAYHSLEYVIAGRGKLCVNDKCFTLYPGAMFYYGPATQHEIVTDPAQPLLKFFVDFYGSRLVKTLKCHSLASHEPRYPSAPVRIRSLFEQLQQYGREAESNAPAICVCLLELLILHTSESAAEPVDAKDSAQYTYRRCRDLIEQRFLELHSLADIAAACHVNSTYLCRLFRRYGSESAYGLLIRLKMRHAADMLHSSQVLIKQAAKEVGFEDPYHFSRVFKRVYSIAPQIFLRESHRSAND